MRYRFVTCDVFTDRPFTVVDIPDSTWKGIRVEVGANEAVSCTQTVTK